MGKISTYKKFIDELIFNSELSAVYRKLRHAFQREGWSQKDLERAPYYPNDIMSYYQKLQTLIDELRSELTSYFGDIDIDEFNDYLMDKLKQIDLEIPLKDGNIKRNNSRDEDY